MLYQIQQLLYHTTAVCQQTRETAATSRIKHSHQSFICLLQELTTVLGQIGC